MCHVIGFIHHHCSVSLVANDGLMAGNLQPQSCRRLVVVYQEHPDETWLACICFTYYQMCIADSLKNTPLMWNFDVHFVAHDDVTKWKYFPRYWPFVREIHRSPVNSPHKGQWRGALMFSLICPWINGWVNNHEAANLRRHRTHYDVIVMRVSNAGHLYSQQWHGRFYIYAFQWLVSTETLLPIANLSPLLE